MKTYSVDILRGEPNYLLLKVEGEALICLPTSNVTGIEDPAGMEVSGHLVLDGIEFLDNVGIAYDIGCCWLVLRDTEGGEQALRIR